MEKTKTPKQIIQSYLEERAKNDPLFASVYAKPNKNINECLDYILSVAKLLEINESTWQQLQGVVDVVKSVPVGLRFLLGLAMTIGGGFCEYCCSKEN